MEGTLWPPTRYGFEAESFRFRFLVSTFYCFFHWGESKTPDRTEWRTTKAPVRNCIKRTENYIRSETHFLSKRGTSYVGCDRSRNVTVARPKPVKESIICQKTDDTYQKWSTEEQEIAYFNLRCSHRKEVRLKEVVLHPTRHQAWTKPNKIIYLQNCKEDSRLNCIDQIFNSRLPFRFWNEKWNADWSYRPLQI